MTLEVPTELAHSCPRSVGMQLDHLMLAMEAMNLEAVEGLLAAVQELGLEKWIPHRVGFWRLRNTNPLRKHPDRKGLQWEEAKALVAVVCRVAQQLNTVLRFLVMTHQQVLEGKIEALGLQQNQAYLDFYTDRFRELYQARMRHKLSDRDALDLANYLLVQLLFISGSGGEQRLWHSLIDGAVD